MSSINLSKKSFYVYALSFTHGFKYYIKIGYTSQKPSTRAKRVDPRCKVIGYVAFPDEKTARAYELFLHDKLKTFRVNLTGIVRSGGTEFFKSKALKKDFWISSRSFNANSDWTLKPNIDKRSFRSKLGESIGYSYQYFCQSLSKTGKLFF